MVVTLIAKLLGGAATKLLTEKFVMKILLIILKKVSESTRNDVDDQLVATVEKAYFKE